MMDVLTQDAFNYTDNVAFSHISTDDQCPI